MAARARARGATGGRATPPSGAFERVYTLVRRIPRGRVMSYGQISRLLRGRLSARAVGWAMHGCPDDVPWQRVVNAAGACSTDGLGPHPRGWQRSLLEAERIVFRPNGTLDLERYRWAPGRRSKPPAAAKVRRRPGVV